ncbi:hypothetical protein C7B81_02070 [Aphanothece cf. minutissima CCALA 015]|uniref:WYL domain-containing protein n=2 Tax=Aphanothece TaxID=1121 RepID=A0ABX5FC91_9CHRO|nr:hypothetical protein C7B81_02070 [Aphanothece cf. minutissima CCALA 015]
MRSERPMIRGHLMIGPPASGKSQLAAVLAGLLTEPGQPPPLLLTADERLQEQLRQAIDAGRSVIVDGSHVTRPSRLELIQATPWPQPVEWIGWWLTTPLECCRQWNRHPGRQEVGDGEVESAHHHLNASKAFQPGRQEGFAALVKIDPSGAGQEGIGPLVRARLAGLATSISQGRRRSPKRQSLHGYSRLLDFERLMHLLQLLGEGQAPTAVEAAVLLEQRHGRCYADGAAIAADLAWLEAQGFVSATPVTTLIVPPACAVVDEHLGGWCSYGDRDKFRQLITFLRHLLHHPFERPGKDDDDQQGRARRTSGPDKVLYEHLGQQLTTLYPEIFPWGGWRHSLHNDVTDVIHAYGLSNGHARMGFTIGTSLLSAQELVEMHNIVLDATTRQHDPSPAGYELRDKLQHCLPRAGIAIDDRLPVRATANRSIVDPELVAPHALTRHARELEQAIASREPIVIAKLRHAGRFQIEESAPATATRGDTGPWTVWPLQLLFHNVAWYLAYEMEPEPGQSHGRLRTDRLDWLEWRPSPTTAPPPRSHAVQKASVDLLGRLIKRSGGIHFGRDARLQWLIGGTNARRAREAMSVLRFRCNEQVFPFFMAGTARFPGQMRLSKRRLNDPWRHRPEAEALHQIAPDLNDADHPYPVEIRLPPWTLKEDVDFRRWLFGFGDAIYIERPEELRIMQVNQARRLMATIAAKAEAENAARLEAWERQP